MAASTELTQSASQGSAEAVDLPCSICQTRDKREVESSHYCVDCDANMCAACTQTHVCYPTMASHQVVDITKAPGTPAQKPQLPTQRCDEHHGRIIDHYCQDDDTTACETCVNIYHRNCMHMKYIPQIAKGTSKGKSSQAIKTSVSKLKTKLKQLKSVKEGDLIQLDQAEAQTHGEVRDLKARLHKYIDNLADAEDVKIKSKFQEKKGEVQKDIATIDDQIDATEMINKKLNDCKGDNESELFVYIKQGEKVDKDVKQKLQTLTQSKVAIPAYKIDSTIEKSLKDEKSLGQFEKMTIAKINRKIKVSHAKDQEHFHRYIDGICVLPDASIILADFNNYSLKLVDSSFQQAGHLDIPGKPFDVCYTDNNEVAVSQSLPDIVQFVSVKSTMKMTHSFDVGAPCRGIDYSNGELFICCGFANQPDACVRVYSLSGTLQRIIQLSQEGERMFNYLDYITISSCGSKLHVTDCNSRIITTDRVGKLLHYTKPDLDVSGLDIDDIFDFTIDLVKLCGICCLDTGDLLICDTAGNCIHHISGDGRKLGKLPTGQDGIKWPRAICYDPESSRMFVSTMGSDHITMYDIQKI